MKLWHIAQWGNKDEGANGGDTNCIVRAPDFESAVKYAENYFKDFGWNEGEADVVYLMGVDFSERKQTELVVLMWRNPAFNLCRYPAWHRSPVSNMWETSPEPEEPDR